jgi:hypothetical protein
MSLYRLTIAVILAALVCLGGYAWRHDRHKRFARAWAEEIINPTHTLIR